mmetsp:Transcript_2512/g.5849  ORF Transcript_2512/g.5849 Transcript_2512/m.5849 type:complete len:210 (+) Transcript_2512:208-837(+)
MDCPSVLCFPPPLSNPRCPRAAGGPFRWPPRGHRSSCRVSCSCSCSCSCSYRRRCARCRRNRNRASGESARRPCGGSGSGGPPPTRVRPIRESPGRFPRRSTRQSRKRPTAPRGQRDRRGRPTPSAGPQWRAWQGLPGRTPGAASASASAIASPRSIASSIASAIASARQDRHHGHCDCLCCRSHCCRHCAPIPLRGGAAKRTQWPGRG